MNQLITFAEIHVEANGCARAHQPDGKPRFGSRSKPVAVRFDFSAVIRVDVEALRKIDGAIVDDDKSAVGGGAHGEYRAGKPVARIVGHIQREFHHVIFARDVLVEDIDGGNAIPCAVESQFAIIDRDPRTAHNTVARHVDGNFRRRAVDDERCGIETAVVRGDGISALYEFGNIQLSVYDGNILVDRDTVFVREGERQRTARFRVGGFALQRDGYGDFDLLPFQRGDRDLALFDGGARKVEVIRAVGIIADRACLPYLGRNGCGILVNFDAGKNDRLVIGRGERKPRASPLRQRERMNQRPCAARIRIQIYRIARANEAQQHARSHRRRLESGYLLFAAVLRRINIKCVLPPHGAVGSVIEQNETDIAVRAVCHR